MTVEYRRGRETQRAFRAVGSRVPGVSFKPCVSRAISMWRTRTPAARSVMSTSPGTRSL